MSLQDEFNAIARARLADPMVTETPRTASTLDNLGVEEFTPEEIEEEIAATEGQDIEFDAVPLTFEEEVILRLSATEAIVVAILDGNKKTHSAIERIVSMVETISAQVEPVMTQVLESKLFRMFVPARKG